MLANFLYGEWYQFWSGIGSDFGEITLVLGFATWWHHRNCIEKRCWRKGHPDPKHGHPICRVHTKNEHEAFSG